MSSQKFNESSSHLGHNHGGPASTSTSGQAMSPMPSSSLPQPKKKVEYKKRSLPSRGQFDVSMSVALDSVRYHMLRAANNRQVTEVQGNKKSLWSLENVLSKDKNTVKHFESLESKVLTAFHSAGANSNQVNVAKYILEEVPTCQDILLLRITDGLKAVRLYCRGNRPLQVPEAYRVEELECVQELISSKHPAIHSDETSRLLMLLCQWKPLFLFIPDIVVGIPIVYANGEVQAIVALAFKRRLPKHFAEKKLPILRETLHVLVPYAFVSQGVTDNEEQVASFHIAIQALEKVEKFVIGQSVNTALSQIGVQIQTLAKCKYLTMFTLDTGDKLLKKIYANHGAIGKPSCPHKKLHKMQEIPLAQKGIEILAWVAEHRRGIRINQTSDLFDHGIKTKNIHTIGNCVSNSVLVVPVIDISGENILIVEVCNDGELITNKEFESVMLFCVHVANLLTCAVLMDKRERTFRKRNIINEMLCSISYIKKNKVTQTIENHRKNSAMYRGQFDEFYLSVRTFPEGDLASLALEIFQSLDYLREFQIKKSVLVRFILSTQQGYGPLPYHNWYHAVSVAHFAYLLIKKLRLVELGHFTKLETLALIVSALTHDVDHRGTNNQFQSYTNSDIFKLYACEESVMERHHLSIAMAILHREDCNILESFNDADYKYFVELLTWNIIATDISKHLKNREALFMEARSTNIRQRKMARLSLFMTAADLCDNVKKWDDTLPTVKGILTEFFNQGDMERQLGFTPIPMMDRYAAYVPLIEYKFVKYIVCPVYRYLAEIYEELVPCLENILAVEDLWTLATRIFDARAQSNILDILELPEMKESELLKFKSKVNIEEIKNSRFAPTAPPPPQPASRPTSGGGSVSKPVGAGSLLLEKKSSVELKEVDTGENRCRCKCCRCCRKRY